MKKIVVCLMLMVGMMAFGKVEEKLELNSNGTYSGSAKLGLVSRGRIVKRPIKQMLVINEITDNGEIKSELNFKHKGLKAGDVEILKKKIVTRILEEGRDGKMSPINIDNKVVAKIIDENADVINGKIINVKALDGEAIGKITYDLKNGKQIAKKNVQEIISRMKVETEKSGSFVDKTATLAIAINN